MCNRVASLHGTAVVWTTGSHTQHAVLPATAAAPAATAVAGLLAPLPLPKLRQLGGKFGEEVMSKLGVSTVGELVRSMLGSY